MGCGLAIAIPMDMSGLRVAALEIAQNRPEKTMATVAARVANFMIAEVLCSDFSVLVSGRLFDGTSLHA